MDLLVGNKETEYVKIEQEIHFYRKMNVLEKDLKATVVTISNVVSFPTLIFVTFLSLVSKLFGQTGVIGQLVVKLVVHLDVWKERGNVRMPQMNYLILAIVLRNPTKKRKTVISLTVVSILLKNI